MKGLATCALLALPGVAHAGVTVEPMLSFQYDDNLFRASKAVRDTLGNTKSDVSVRAGATVYGSAQPGSWLIDFDASLAHQWFRRNDLLDNTNYSGRIAVSNDALAGGSSGLIGTSLEASRSRGLSNYGDLGTRIRNVQTITIVSNRTTVAITPDIRVVIDPRFISSTNSSDLIKQNDYRQYGAGIGLGYFSPLGNYAIVKYSRRYTDGLEPRPAQLVPGGPVINAPIDLVDDSADLNVRYQPSPITSIEGNVSYVKRNDKSVLGSDYKGPIGNITLAYMPRETFDVRVSAGRQLEALSYLFVDSVRTNYISAVVYAAVANTIALQGTALYSHRKFDLSQLAVTGVGTLTSENLTRLELAASYLPWERIQLGGRIAYEHRSADLAIRRYDAFTASASISIPFTVAGQARETRRRFFR